MMLNEAVGGETTEMFTLSLTVQPKEELTVRVYVWFVDAVSIGFGQFVQESPIAGDQE
jgi:hypothetical protein